MKLDGCRFVAVRPHARRSSSDIDTIRPGSAELGPNDVASRTLAAHRLADRGQGRGPPLSSLLRTCAFTCAHRPTAVA
jgi:hypothetical protein